MVVAGSHLKAVLHCGSILDPYTKHTQEVYQPAKNHLISAGRRNYFSARVLRFQIPEYG
jgi:hypothetical protein